MGEPELAEEWDRCVAAQELVTVNARSPVLEIGQRVPAFTLSSLAGETRSLDSFLEGQQAVVVVFWSGVCSHCVRYDSYLNEFPQRHTNLSLVALASREGETNEQIQMAVDQRGLRFCLLRDSDRRVAHRYSVQHTPTAFLIDSNQHLLYRGAIDNFKYPRDADYRAYLEDAIGAYLDGRPFTRPQTHTFGCPIESVYYNLPGP